MEEYDEMANEPCPLPPELVIDILTMVPAKPVLQFKCVSKEWLKVISNPNFIKRHVSQSIRTNSGGTLIVHQGSTLYTVDFHNSNFRATQLYFPEKINIPQPGKLRIVGSCNGLLCIEFGSQIGFYNPVTQAHKIMPECSLGRNFETYQKPQIVFAYDCISDDYKVFFFRNEITISYSLGTNFWDVIENPPWEYESVQFPGVLANNSVYWMDSNHENIKALDLFSQKYYEMPFPEKISPGYSPKLAVLGRSLYIVTYYFDLWKLKDSGVQEPCWTRIFRCPSSQWNIMYKLGFGLLSWLSGVSLACSEDGCQILVARVCGPLNFICCDLKSQEATMIEIPGLTSTRFSGILPWAGTLVPLSD